jgi:preprotein translocase subunit YajC
MCQVTEVNKVMNVSFIIGNGSKMQTLDLHLFLLVFFLFFIYRHSKQIKKRVECFMGNVSDGVE